MIPADELELLKDHYKKTYKHNFDGKKMVSAQGLEKYLLIETYALLYEIRQLLEEVKEERKRAENQC